MERMTKEKMRETMNKMAYFINEKCTRDCKYEECRINKLCDAIFNDDTSDGIAPCHEAPLDVIIKAFEKFDLDEYKRENGKHE